MSTPRARARWREEYLAYLYSPTGQAIIAKHSIGRVDAAVRGGEDHRPLPEDRAVQIDRFGGWKKAQAVHFGDGGVFDQIYKPSN